MNSNALSRTIKAPSTCHLAPAVNLTNSIQNLITVVRTHHLAIHSSIPMDLSRGATSKIYEVAVKVFMKPVWCFNDSFTMPVRVVQPMLDGKNHSSLLTPNKYSPQSKSLLKWKKV